MADYLTHSSEWPDAVDRNLICQTKEDYISKAKGILDFLIDEELEKKNFFDYNGFTNYIASDYGFVCKPHKKFDVILLYDVVDHIENPFSFINEIQNKLASSGKVFIRCHPWSSRHADHDLRNKAYLHLIENESFSQSKVFHNKVDYNQLFSNFNIEYKREVRQYLEPFFVNGPGRLMLLDKLCKFPDNIQYMDFKLSLKKQFKML